VSRTSRTDEAAEPLRLGWSPSRSVEKARKDAFSHYFFARQNASLPRIHAPNDAFGHPSFDLNASDSSDDEPPTTRFDLNDSDPSDNESPVVGRLSMLQGGPSSQDTGQATVTDEDDENITIAAVKAAKAARDAWHAPGNPAKAALDAVNDAKAAAAARQAAAVAKAAADAAADAAAAIRSTKKAAKAARVAAADAADAARARATYAATTKTSLPPGIFIASTDTVLYSNQRFVLAVTQSLVDSGIAPHSALGIVFEISAMRRHHVQARIPPEGVQARVPPGCLFQIPKSELWRAVVLEQELAPRYVPAVGSDAFSDAHPLSTAATNEQEWTRGRLAHKFLEGVAHGLLIAPRPVSAQHAGDNVPPDDRPVAPPGFRGFDSGDFLVVLIGDGRLSGILRIRAALKHREAAYVRRLVVRGVGVVEIKALSG